jgi:hypothetical protein
MDTSSHATPTHVTNTTCNAEERRKEKESGEEKAPNTHLIPEDLYREAISLEYWTYLRSCASYAKIDLDNSVAVLRANATFMGELEKRMNEKEAKELMQKLEREQARLEALQLAQEEAERCGMLQFYCNFSFEYFL